MKPLKRIVHVEDDQDILDVAAISLEAVGGFEVTQFIKGAQAVSKAPDLAPDLFLLDMMMPEMDGIETLETLRRQPHLNKVPAIFVTAKSIGLPEDYSELGSHVIGIIEKPFDAVHLASEISELWQSYHQD